MTLLELLYNKPDQILLEATNSLVRAHLPHYEKFKASDINERFKKLLHSITKCVEKNSCNELTSYMDKLSDERFSMGFEPTEVLVALNIFEEALWKNIGDLVDEDKQIAAMKLISSVISKAKQEMIGEYALLEKS